MTVVRPGGIVKGDLMLVELVVGSTAGITPPAGWSVLVNNSAYNGGTFRTALYYKYAEASETNPVFAIASASPVAGKMFVFRNVKALSVSAYMANSAATKSSWYPINAGSTITAPADNVLLLVVNNNTLGGSRINTPLSFGELMDESTNMGGMEVAYRYLHKNRTLSGSDIQMSTADGSQTIAYSQAIYLEPYSNNPPTLTLTSPADNQTLSEGSALDVIGAASDADNGNTVTIKMKVDSGQEFVVGSGTSDGTTPIPFTKSLTYAGGFLKDGTSIVSGRLSSGAHTLAVWAEDNQGGISSRVTRTFNTPEPPAGYKLPNALSFDGVDDYVEIPSRIIPGGNGDFTIELMFKTSVTGSPQYLYALFDPTPSPNVYGIYIILRSDNKIEAQIQGDTGSVMSVRNDVRDGKWHHLALVREGTALKLYIDGVLDNSRTIANNPSITAYTTTRLGTSYGETPSLYFQGSIALPRFWNDARTAAELQAGKNVTYPTNEQGYQDELIFNEPTGALKTRVSGVYGTMYGGVKWGNTFTPIDPSIALPSSNALAKDNIDFIRQKVNEFRQTNGFSAYSWTDPTIIRGVTPVKAAHWNEIQQAIDEVYNSLGET